MEIDLPSLVEILRAFLPGLLAATVFHAMTPYPKRDVFDRVVAAAIFTMVVQIIVWPVQHVLLWFGSIVFVLGEWSSEAALAWGAGLGVVVGGGWSVLINRGLTHKWPHRWGFTKKSALPSQWFLAFSEYERYVTLHLVDGRRVMGYPAHWPDEPDRGHFVLHDFRWLLDNGAEVELPNVEAFLLDAKSVTWVEFLRMANDPVLAKAATQFNASREILISFAKEKKDGK
jgi:hypothetical protein